MAGRHSRGSISTGESIVPVTKSDTVDLPNGPCRALLVGTAGTATVIDGGGATRTDIPLQAGYNPIVVQRILLGGTSADIWALY